MHAVATWNLTVFLYDTAFTAETGCVYCEVRTGSLNVILRINVRCSNGIIKHGKALSQTCLSYCLLLGRLCYQVRLQLLLILFMNLRPVAKSKHSHRVLHICWNHNSSSQIPVHRPVTKRCFRPA
jgi:hypothetical protein